MKAHTAFLSKNFASFAHERGHNNGCHSPPGRPRACRVRLLDKDSLDKIVKRQQMTSCRSCKLTLYDQRRVACALALSLLCGLVGASLEENFPSDEARANRDTQKAVPSVSLVPER